MNNEHLGQIHNILHSRAAQKIFRSLLRFEHTYDDDLSWWYYKKKDCYSATCLAAARASQGSPRSASLGMSALVPWLPWRPWGGPW